MHVYIAHKHIKTCYYQKRENTLCRLAGSLSAAGLLKFFSFHKNIQHFKKNNVALWLNPNFLKPLLCANLPLWGNCLVVFWLSQVFPSSNHLIFCFGAKKVNEAVASFDATDAALSIFAPLTQPFSVIHAWAHISLRLWWQLLHSSCCSVWCWLIAESMNIHLLWCWMRDWIWSVRRQQAIMPYKAWYRGGKSCVCMRQPLLCQGGTSDC